MASILNSWRTWDVTDVIGWLLFSWTSMQLKSCHQPGERPKSLPSKSQGNLLLIHLAIGPYLCYVGQSSLSVFFWPGSLHWESPTFPTNKLASSLLSKRIYRVSLGEQTSSIRTLNLHSNSLQHICKRLALYHHQKVFLHRWSWPCYTSNQPWRSQQYTVPGLKGNETILRLLVHPP